jgi:formylglycine-generating enzyme required for sulfatase activity
MDFQCLASRLLYKKPSIKKHLIFLLFVTVCVSLCLVTTDELLSQRGMKPIKVRTRIGKEIELYRDSYALVVGNSSYTKGWNPIGGALQDVEEVAAALKKHGFTVTLEKDLTKPEFEDAFEKFVTEGRDENNRLLFYYAGHGHTEKLANGDDLGYLVMVDAPLPEDDRINHRKSVDMESLVTQAKRIQARHVLFIFDSCFSGTILNAARNQEQPENISYSVQQPVRQFITAGRANEGVPDKSVFKQAFLNLIEGSVRQPVPDDYITGEELGFYLKHQVPIYNKGQHPQYGKINDPNLDQGDFVFVLREEEVWAPSTNDFAKMATLTVTSTPSGANIYLDNAWIGKTPLASYKVNTGGRYEKQVTVSLELSGYKYRVANLTLREGEKTPWEVRLEKLIPRMATLTVTSTPSGASVYVDGSLIGPTPLHDYKIDTGLAREKQVAVGLELSGYKYRVENLTLKGGKNTPWEVHLEKMRQIQNATVPSSVTPEGMVLIPAGEFQMGSNDGEFDEKPVHTVYVDAFYMDAYEVTNAQYKEFVDANPQWRKDHIPSRYHDGNYLKHWTGSSYGRSNHPVVYVSWYGAMAYAEWAGKRLPTEAEWERAARSGLLGKKYPWGNLLDSSKANYRGGGTTGVGTYPPNKYGLYDIVGNVWEWCLDAYDGDFYKSSPRRNPIAGKVDIAQVIRHFADAKAPRVLRGGAWNNSRSALRIADRRRFNPTFTDNGSGFRCARTISP